MTTRYTTKGENPRQGVFLAQSASGKIVLDMADGEVLVAAPDEVEAVRPFTVTLIPMPLGMTSHAESPRSRCDITVRTVAGAVQPNDVLLLTGYYAGIWMVRAVDTKGGPNAPALTGCVLAKGDAFLPRPEHG